MTVPLPLDGIKVVDFSQGVASPHAGLLLALQGADVIKIEPTERGDWARLLGRNYGDASAFSIYYNRGKRSISVDLKTAEGRALAYRIAAQADVVIDAFRPGVMQRFGLHYDKLKAANPSVIYLAITGFGQTGSNAQQPATDAVVQGYSGLMSLNKGRDGVPQRFPLVAIDIVTGLFGCQAVMAALLRKFRFGEGQYIDCSLLQCATAFQSPRLIEHHFQGGMPEIMYVPLGVFRTKDSFLSISVNRDEHFIAFCRAIEREDLASDPRYIDRASRVAHEPELMDLICAAFLTRTTEEWSERFTAVDVLHARIRSYDDVLQDQEMADLGYIEWIKQDGVDKDVPIPNVPGARGANAYGALTTSPHIGQHSREIMAQYGMSEADIERLLDQGVVKQFN
jgi:crotonobetainyl-CoA:carnitine CoA-transferase CaiB-like acyl-CoA transferase